MMEIVILKILSRSRSWSDIYEPLSVLNNKNQKLAGSIFESFCKLYFLYEPSVSSDYKSVWLFNEVPKLVRDRLGFSQIDHGVDLVLEDNDGKLTVVQCKFKNDQGTNLSWTEHKIANLFAEGDKADHFIVFTNASGLDAHSRNKKANQFTLVSLSDLLEIRTETIERMTCFIKKSEIIPAPKFFPRDYQREAISKVVSGFQEKNRGQLILPCGSGKTLIALWVKERLKPSHTLVLVPSLALLRQVKNEWHRHQLKWAPYLCVCSEDNIDNNSDDLPKVHTYEIGGNVTTDAEKIQKFLSSQSEETIIFATYQSLKVIQKAIQTIKDFSFDLILCDEAHKTAGSKKADYALVHEQSKIPARKRLYMTATPRIISPQAKNRLNKDVLTYLVDMSDKKTFGVELYRMSFEEAIDKKILVDYQILAVGVSDSELQNALLNREFVNDDNTIDEIANNIALQKTMKKYQAHHAITFHSSIKKAENFKTRHKEIFPSVLTHCVSGKQTTNDRKSILDQFEKAKNAVVTNARCLTEGVDIPAVDLVYFCDPKNSKVDIVQATGRALRRSDRTGKKLGYIVVPIFHKDSTELNEMLENSAFKNLVSVVRALCDHDERLQVEITKIKIGMGIRKVSTSSLHIVIEDEVPLIKLEGFEKSLKQSLFASIVEKVPIEWRPFEEARTYIHGIRLRGESEWRQYSKGELLGKGEKPIDIPTTPNAVYKEKGWVSWGDWLGTGRISDQYKKSLLFLPFNQAREFTHNIGIKSETEWRKYCKGELPQKEMKPDNIPADPAKVYQNEGWVGMGDWLRTGRIADQNKIFLPFIQARTFVRILQLKNQKEWVKYATGKLTTKGMKPDNIPADPASVYKDNGWISLGDWLGTGTVRPGTQIYRSFEDARKFARSLRLKSSSEWFKYSKEKKLPPDIPTAPNATYRNKGWSGMGDWLGTGTIASRLRIFRPFLEAKRFAQSLNLKSASQWREFYHKNIPLLGISDMPIKPYQTYKNKGWKGWGDWLGTGRVADQLLIRRPFLKAREFSRSLKLNSRAEWNQYYKRKMSEKGRVPDDIPLKPDRRYKNNGWVGWSDWLGKK